MSPSDDAIQRGLYPSLARILDRAGNIVGGAFLVTDRELITCAHVVNLALGFSPSATEQPSAELEISFVNHPTAIPTSARILDWHPIGDTVEDIAILQLTHPAGPKVRPAVIVQPKTLFQHRYWCLGFPVGHPMGQQSTGRMLRLLANGWIQMEDVKTEGPQIDYGYSGSCVWDEDSQGVVGMVTTISQKRRQKTAFMIPVEILANAWKPLKDCVKDPPIRTDTLELELEFDPDPPTFRSATLSTLMTTQYHTARADIKAVEGEGMPAVMRVLFIVVLTAARFFGYTTWTIVNHITGKRRTLELATFSARVCNGSAGTMDGILLDIEFPEQLVLVGDGARASIDHPTKSGVVRVLVEIPELRAHYCIPLPRLHMVCSHRRTTPAVWGEWRATSHSVGGSAGGPLEIPLSGQMPRLLPMLFVVPLIAAFPVWFIFALVRSPAAITMLIGAIFLLPLLGVLVLTQDLPRGPGA